MDDAPVPGWGGGASLVVYPHFQAQVVPGWLDKSWRRRHRASPFLDNVVVLAPQPDWVRTLPGAKLPDRSDFKAYRNDREGRMSAWREPAPGRRVRRTRGGPAAHHRAAVALS